MSVSIIVDDREAGRVLADLYRSGLREDLGGGATGHHEFRFEFDPPLSRFKEHRVEVKFTNHDQHLPNGMKVLPRPAPGQLPLLPIILTSVGRCGTTLMMSELARRAEIVTGDAYPFEVKLVAYYSGAFNVLVGTEDRANSTDPLTMFARANRNFIGHNPYNSPEYYQPRRRQQIADFFLKDVPDEYSELFRNLTLRYYNALRTEQQKDGARFFAEKGEIDEVAREGARLFFGAVRELVIVRDPRDLLCSAAAFWKLPRPEAFEMLQTTLPRLEQIHQARGTETHFIRYEDLIRDPAGTWRGIYEFIGIEPTGFAGGDAAADLFKMHGTSGNPDASIGRWRHDLTAEEIEQCQAVFPAFMQRFGYTESGVADRWGAEPGANTPAAAAPEEAPRRVAAPEPPSLTSVEPTPPSPSALSLQDLLVRFESLGQNCEFGLVQRHCGAEPVGLLRFSSTPLPELLAALKARFDGLGEPGNISIELSPDGREYMVKDGRYGFFYHAWVLAGEMDPAAIYQREISQLPLLVRKMVEDLTAGEKIFVYHGMEPLSEAEALSLAEGLRQYGPGTLLWIELADAAHPPGSVDWVADTVLKGHVDRFAPGEDAHNLSLSCWIAICRDALRLWQGRRAAPPAVVEPELPPEPVAEVAAAAPDPVPTIAPQPEPEVRPHELMMRFESLGENCEFGLVQRRCGAEPLGLFRFASAPLPNLQAALEARFEGFGAPDNIAVELSSNGREYMVADQRFGFLYHAWVLADEMRPEEIRERETRRLPLLIRKLVEDLAAGRKLLVVRGMDRPLEPAQVEGLLAVLRRYGPNTLFWVELADAEHPAGSVDWAGPDLLRGYIDRFAPGEDAHDLSLDCWIAICRGAERLWRGRRQDGEADIAAAAE